MTASRVPGGERDDPLLRAVAEHWDEIQRLADEQQRERLRGLVDGTAEPDPAEARAALADELLDLLPPDHPVIRVLRAGVAFRRGAAAGTFSSDDPGPGQVNGVLGRLTGADVPSRTRIGNGTIPVTIYLADEHIHAEVEKAVETLLATAGLRIQDREDPVKGSWFRRMVAGAQQGLRSPAGREATLIAEHAFDSRMILPQDADVTARLMQNLPPLLGALQPTKDAMLRVGALLIVKVDWTVNVFQLTAAQQARLDHHPQLATSPREIAAVLNLIPEEDAMGGSYPVEDGQARKLDPPRAAGQSRLRGPGPAA